MSKPRHTKRPWAAEALLDHLAAAESRDWLRAHEAQRKTESEVAA